MPATVGILPAAGAGSRLGMLFPKPLSPTITDAGIRPLYTHAYRRLRHLTRDVRIVVGSDPLMKSLPGAVEKPFQGELPSSLAFIARRLHPDTICAVALPDSIWFPANGFDRLMAVYLTEDRPIDGVLGLFEGDPDVLDKVSVDSSGLVKAIEKHGSEPWQPAMASSNGGTDGSRNAPMYLSYLSKLPTSRARARGTVLGWGCFIATAGCLAGLTDDRPLGPQLAEYRLSSTVLGGPYLDLGTPQRYIDFHDQRTNR